MADELSYMGRVVRVLMGGFAKVLVKSSDSDRASRRVSMGDCQ